MSLKRNFPRIFGLGFLGTFGIVLFGWGTAAQAQSDNSDLAKQLANPVASLISVPFQLNYDGGYGSEDGDKTYLNVQPVVPLSLTDDWNLISRTILPLVYQNDIRGNSGSDAGLGDTVQSFFISPVEPTSGGLIWGVGPALLLPTATDDEGPVGGRSNCGWSLFQGRLDLWGVDQPYLEQR